MTQFDKEHDHSESSEDLSKTDYDLKNVYIESKNEQSNQSPKLIELNNKFDKLKKKLNFLIGIEMQSI